MLPCGAIFLRHKALLRCVSLCFITACMMMLAGGRQAGHNSGDNLK